MQVHFTLAFFLGAGLVSAQSLPFSVSSQCSDTLKDLLTSPDTACLNPSTFLNLAINSAQSIPDTINNWLGGICSAGSCSNDALASIVSQLTTGCAQEMASIGLTASASDITSIVQQVYPTVRKIACLKDDATNQLCVTETSAKIIQAVGQLDLSNFSFDNIINDVKTLFTTLNIQSLACSNCTKEAYTIALGDFPNVFSEVNPEVQAVCGASFTDGNLPDGITQSAAPGVFTTAQNSRAAHLQSYGGIGITLLALASILLI